MHSLEEIGLTEQKSGNYAGYSKNHNYVFCGWMDIHEDSNSLGPAGNKIFDVMPAYWNDKAYFVYKPGKNWVSLSKSDFISRKKIKGIKYSKNGFMFNATKDHGLVTLEIAKKLNTSGFLSSEEYRSFMKFCDNYRDKPILVWKWGQEINK